MGVAASVDVTRGDENIEPDNSGEKKGDPSEGDMLLVGFTNVVRERFIPIFTKGTLSNFIFSI
jgi:hypothetical protein